MLTTQLRKYGLAYKSAEFNNRLSAYVSGAPTLQSTDPTESAGRAYTPAAGKVTSDKKHEKRRRDESHTPSSSRRRAVVLQKKPRCQESSLEGSPLLGEIIPGVSRFPASGAVRVKKHQNIEQLYTSTSLGCLNFEERPCLDSSQRLF
jgi:hypothetical protein